MGGKSQGDYAKEMKNKITNSHQGMLAFKQNKEDQFDSD